MKSALQLELQDLHGLPYIAGIIWFVLLGLCLIAIISYLLFQKKHNSKASENKVIASEKKSRPKGF